MPKLKPNSGAQKRFGKRANSLKKKAAGRNHILTKRNTKNKRQLRQSDSLCQADERLAKRMLQGS